MFWKELKTLKIRVSLFSVTFEIAILLPGCCFVWVYGGVLSDGILQPQGSSSYSVSNYVYSGVQHQRISSGVEIVYIHSVVW